MSPTPPLQGLTAAKLTTAKGAELKFWIVKANEVASKKVLNWADWEALGVEWKDTVRAGRVFKPIIGSTTDSILSASHDAPDVLGVLPPALSSSMLLNQANKKVDFTSSKGSQITVNTTAPTSPQLTLPASPPNLHLPLTQPLQHEVTILQDLSEAIRGLERCECLHEVIQQIESGAVQSIRECYGPTQYGHCGTADPSRPKYSNLVSKKCKQTEEEASESVPSQEHFRSFRKIVEVVPWCEANLVSKHSKIEYYSGDREFSEALWNAKWADKTTMSAIHFLTSTLLGNNPQKDNHYEYQLFVMESKCQSVKLSFGRILRYHMVLAARVKTAVEY
ncbi:hypothetical protein B0H10DRAFT_1954719 [Mycena sp. CBHHK59/15]|nr:hypothetical protein B0H10DRAFT_1954719 [Mycena sp. CBHHK59/15]